MTTPRDATAVSEGPFDPRPTQCKEQCCVEGVEWQRCILEAGHEGSHQVRGLPPVAPSPEDRPAPTLRAEQDDGRRDGRTRLGGERKAAISYINALQGILRKHAPDLKVPRSSADAFDALVDAAIAVGRNQAASQQRDAGTPSIGPSDAEKLRRIAGRQMAFHWTFAERDALLEISARIDAAATEGGEAPRCTCVEAEQFHDPDCPKHPRRSLTKNGGPND